MRGREERDPARNRAIRLGETFLRIFTQCDFTKESHSRDRAISHWVTTLHDQYLYIKTPLERS